LCRVASVRFSIWSVFKRDISGASLPIHSAISAGVSSWLTGTGLSCATSCKIAAKLCRLTAPASGRRTT
jgi:hypothetical protein